MLSLSPGWRRRPAGCSAPSTSSPRAPSAASRTSAGERGTAFRLCFRRLSSTAFPCVSAASLLQDTAFQLRFHRLSSPRQCLSLRRCIAHVTTKETISPAASARHLFDAALATPQLPGASDGRHRTVGAAAHAARAGRPNPRSQDGGGLRRTGGGACPVDPERLPEGAEEALPGVAHRLVTTALQQPLVRGGWGAPPFSAVLPPSKAFTAMFSEG